MHLSQAKICLIVPYFGKWPVWFPAFLQSCRYNPTVDWLFLTDCEVPRNPPANVRFVPWTLQAFNALATEKLGFSVAVEHPYKLVDFRPAFGIIFEDYIKDYQFWGHCDVDVIWGNIRKFITDEILDEYDLISSRKGTLSGHFTLYRNTRPMNTLYTRHKEYRHVFESQENHVFDEIMMADLVREQGADIRVYWPRYLLNFADANRKPIEAQPWRRHAWYWERGTLYNLLEQADVMCLHFIGWKNTLKFCSFNLSDDPEAFYISYSHIGTDKSSPPLGSWFRAFLSRFRFTDKRLKIYYRWRLGTLKNRILGRGSTQSA